jgi:elongation factor 1 alpha-like protein
LNTKPSSKDKASLGGLSEDVAGLSVKEPTKVKHKNLDVLKEFQKANIKNSASFVVIGMSLSTP